jgi:D-alanyl-lipoteichoic acid acyltransferase DltB (MBOAT superfamily)
MLFNSNIFILAFLPVTVLGYYLARSYFSFRISIYWLFATSLFFYGYWDIRYLPLIAGSIVVNFLFARQIVLGGKKSYAVLGIAFNLALLGLFKYANFFVDNVNLISDRSLWIPEIVLPIGISFYTFQQIAFLVDARRGLVEKLNFATYGLFVTFFPQLIAGPIVHHKEMLRQFFEPARGALVARMAAAGVVMFAIGLGKKVIVADHLAQFASPIFTDAQLGLAPHFFTAWSAALAYTFQIYFDFSGYSDMAIGLGLMFAIRLPANFNSPYRALNITDFWRRWHMTLSRFLRDYLYIPLGGSRHGEPRRLLNLAIVMLLGGLWHGAGWTFIIWGGLHGLYLVLNHSWQRLVPARDGTAYRLAAWALTFLAVVFAWVVFRADSLEAAATMYRAMIGLNGIAMPIEVHLIAERLGVAGLLPDMTYFAQNSRSEFYTGLLLTAAAGMIAVFLPNSLQLMRRYRPNTDYRQIAVWSGTLRIVQGFIRRFRLSPSMAVAVGLLLFMSLKAINSGAETEFLYFQF